MQVDNPQQNNPSNQTIDEAARAFKLRLKRLLYHLARCESPKIDVLAPIHSKSFDEFKPKLKVIQDFFQYPNNSIGWIKFDPKNETSGPHISAFEKYIIPALQRTFTDAYDGRRQLALRYLMGELEPNDTELSWLRYKQPPNNLQANLHRNKYLEWEVNWDMHHRLIQRSYSRKVQKDGNSKPATEPTREVAPYSYLLPAFDYFNALVNQYVPNHDTPAEVRKQNNWSSEQAAEALRRTFFGNYIKVTWVKRNLELEQALMQYDHIEHALVADIPDEVESLLVRSEMITNLMGTMFESNEIMNSTIACGRGYVLERLATGYTKPTWLTATVTWVALVTSARDIQQDPTNSNTHIADPRESTGIAQLFCSKHPGSQILTLPYLPPTGGLRQAVENARHANADNLNITQQQARQIYDLLNNIGPYKSKGQLWIILTTSGLLDNDGNFSQADGEAYSFNRLAELTFKYLDLLAQHPILDEKFGGLMLGQILTQHGTPTLIDEIRRENDELVYSIGVEYIKKIVAERNPISWIMSTGNKVDSVYTALQNGIVNSLCIDSKIARSLLERLESDDSK